MKYRKNSPTIPADIDARLNGFRGRVAEMAAEAGLYELEHPLTDLLTPQLRELAWQIHGAPDAAIDALEEREMILRERANEAMRQATDFLASLGRPVVVGSSARPILGWRGSVIIILAAAIRALCMPSLSWRGAAVVTLSTALSVLLLPLFPTIVFAVIKGVAAGVSCARDVIAATVAKHRLMQLERNRWAAADHASRVDRWVAAQMASLVAEYEYHKALAVAARLQQ